MFQKCSNMEKLKPDLIIRGNLIAGKCIGGGNCMPPFEMSG